MKNSESINFTEMQAALYLNVSQSYLRKKRVRGQGPVYVRLGRTIRYRKTDLDAFINDHVVVTNESLRQ